MADLMNKDIPEKASAAKKRGKKSRDVQDTEDDNEETTTRRIKQLGAKFTVMYMLWIGNPQEAFTTELHPAYEPMDRFKEGVEWKRQGEQADLCEVFPKSFYKDFNSDYLRDIVSFMLFLSPNLLIIWCSLLVP